MKNFIMVFLIIVTIIYYATIAEVSRVKYFDQYNCDSLKLEQVLDNFRDGSNL